jgi:hypothetical protein
MKKVAVLALGLAVMGFVLAPVVRAAHEDDLQAIKRAVKQNPSGHQGKEVKWLKVLVVDNRCHKDIVKLTVPISLIEIFFKCADHKHLRINEGECEINLQAVFKELKAAGPMAMVELSEDNETLKVWLE